MKEAGGQLFKCWFACQTDRACRKGRSNWTLCLSAKWVTVNEMFMEITWRTVACICVNVYNFDLRITRCWPLWKERDDKENKAARLLVTIFTSNGWWGLEFMCDLCSKQCEEKCQNTCGTHSSPRRTIQTCSLDYVDMMQTAQGKRYMLVIIDRFTPIPRFGIPS